MAPAKSVFRKALPTTRSTRSTACTASPLHLRIQVHRNTALKKQVQIWLRSFPATAVSRRPLSTAVLPHTQYSTPDDLSPTTVELSPLEQFRTWFADAVKGGKVHEPEAMSLSTATPTGVPSARIVLFKQLDARGFVFFTNYTSRKSAELLANPHAALVFYWREIHRQVRVLGRVEKVSEAESAAYFKSRPLGSRLGAWASPQSAVVVEGEVHARLEEIKARFGANADTEDADVPLPDFWGGWRVVPNEIEFWSGKPSRLHDRVLYTRQGSPFDADAPVWKIERLAP